ncbi:MAG: bifunctional folylpolyglutamate synthase/dihydrofolate synthase [Candidatus Gastranaerophilales bacterium]|nr:bifunctional folylpolyglutamate synthase/dihydrofolate synthase [Candidatus Gastranaerophilales bacterium]
MKNAVEILTSHNKFHINLGLERIEKILALLNNPQNEYQIIHVAGTNGKGSTSKLINDFLIKHFKFEKKIGLFTSPHLFKYNERIRVNNEEIGDYLLDKLIFEVDNLAKSNDIELSEFELITAVAFYYFYIKKVDYVVLEVGLGGLYDATNVVSNSISVITTLDFDHTERLGNTIEEIAIQKAGIIKEKSSVVVAKDNLGYEAIKKCADEKQAKIVELSKVEVKFEDKNYALIDDKKYEFNLLGSHQAKNLALALGAINALGINLDDKTIENVLKNITWKFRLEYNKEKNILIDAGHNPSGIKTLKNFIDDNFKNDKKIFIFGCLKNKDYKTMLDMLDLKENELYFFEFDYPNALKFEELDEKYQAKKISSIKEIEELINNNDCLKIFSGSIYMLGKLFSEVKI